MSKVLAFVTLVALTGCGVDVKGLRDVKVTHEVNMDALTPYVTAYCELANTEPEDVEACVKTEIGKLLSKI
jgi:hypothetical protein